ncbi:MAG: DALR anticodon-binding domain-containing protein, partial [Candidatus Hodarchaeales archaeon]
DELIKITKLEITSRDKFPELTVEENATEIAMAALKFYLLKIAPSKDFVFYPQKSISLYGKTGPYIQYSFVRANRILQKIDIRPSLDVDFNLFKETEEVSLIKVLKNYPEILEEVSKSYSPHILTEYSHQLAASFNLFYEKFRVIGEKNDQIQKSRLLLVKCFRDVIRNCLYMLGINTVNVM